MYFLTSEVYTTWYIGGEGQLEQILQASIAELKKHDCQFSQGKFKLCGLTGLWISSAVLVHINIKWRLTLCFRFQLQGYDFLYIYGHAEPQNEDSYFDNP